MSLSLVVDASVALKWVVREPLQAEAMRFLDRDLTLLAPDLIWSELGNALWKRVRRREMDAEDALGALDIITQLPLQTKTIFGNAGRSLRMAIETGCSAYDCAYLALAENEDTQVVTADRPFFEAVMRSRHAGRALWIEPT